MGTVDSSNSADEFDPLDHLNKLLQPLGLSTADAGGRVSFAGEDPIFSSPHRLAACIGLPIMGCAVAAATIWKMRTGEGQDLHLDLRQAIHGISPEYSWHPTINGEAYPHATAADNPLLIDPYQTKDGRWVMASAVHPRMLADWLRFLGCPPSAEAVRLAFLEWNAVELENAAAKAGLPLAICRQPEEWDAHPQGAILAKKPVIEIRKIADSDPLPFGPGKRPLEDVRILAFAHAVAGGVVGRTLAEQGADVLCATFPNHFEHEFLYNDANAGSRSCNLNLNDDDARARCFELIRTADVIVDNHRGQKLSRFGLAPEQLAEIRPGIVSVSIRAYGLDGPWADRGGSDMNASAATGLMAIEGGASRPRLPPTTLVNDHITGYMAALGATAALIRRAREGGSYHVTVSLARNAMWYRSLGFVDPAQAGAAEVNRLREPVSAVGETPFGTLKRLAPPVAFSRTPGAWRDPILVVRGSSDAEWLMQRHSGNRLARLFSRRTDRERSEASVSSQSASDLATAPLDLVHVVTALTHSFAPDAFKGLDVRYVFRCSESRPCSIVIEDGRYQVFAGEAPHPTAIFQGSASTMAAIMHGDASGVRAYFGGKLTVKGDLMAARYLLNLIEKK